jgi:Tol biopolymer transport system component
MAPIRLRFVLPAIAIIASTSPTFGIDEQRISLAVFAREPAFSPDGDAVAYTGVDPNYPDPDLRVRVHSLAGGSVSISFPPGNNFTTSPSWSPAGTQLALVVPSGTPNAGIWVGPVGAQAAFRITAEAGAGDPAWVREPGNQGSVVYVKDGRLEVVWFGLGGEWVSPPLGLDVAGPISSPSCGPLRQIVFERGGDLWVLDDFDGTERQLTSGPSRDEQPAWSPDGNRIAFASDRGGDWDLWMVLVQGGDPVQLTTDQNADNHPSWSGDGTSIAFSRCYLSTVPFAVSELWLLTDVPLEPVRVESRSWSEVKSTYRE